MKALIFGAAGQDGYYLSCACRKRHMTVVGVSRSSGSWIQGDVSSRSCVESLIREHQPDMIFHLAAVSKTSHDVIYDNHAAIATGTLNILESARQWVPRAKIFITGSGLQFHNTGVPIAETDPFDHQSCYAAARNYSVYLARYFRSMRIQVYVGYLFHHESPLRKDRHICQKIAQAARRIAEGSGEALELGDLSVSKEWSFAGDIAEGIMTLITQEHVFEAVIGSGQAFTIQDWVETCFRHINRDWHKHITEKKDFTPEYQSLVCDPKTINALGWRTVTTLDDLAEIMLARPQDQTCIAD